RTPAPAESVGQGEQLYPAASAPSRVSSASGARSNAQVRTMGSEVASLAIRTASSARAALVADSSQMASAAASCAIWRVKSGRPRGMSSQLHGLAGLWRLAAPALRGKAGPLRFDRRGRPMDEEHPLRPRRSARQPAILFHPVRVRGKAAHLHDLRADGNQRPAQLQLAVAVEKPASARVLRLVPDQ